MVSHRFPLRLLAVALGAVPALAQGRPTAPVGFGGVHGVVAGPDGPIGIGADYKAAFTPAGVAFTPALGDAAPHNLTLQWSLLDIRRGGDVVHEATAVQPAVTGEAVQFARGALTERYDVLANGLEQSFVFDGPLGARGDLVVRGRITCELPATIGDDGTHCWLRPGAGGVHLGTVTGIDAEGRRVQGSQRLHGDVLELVLPAAFVDGASYPLTLDPLLGTQLLLSAGQDAIECDSACSVPNWVEFVTWTRRYSSADTDVYGTYLHDGVPLANLIAFDATTAAARRPQAAFAWTDNRFFVAWEQAASLWTARDLRCAATTWSSGVATKSADVLLAATAADEFAADVAAVPAAPTQNTGDVAVVYRRDNALVAQRLGVADTGTPVLTGTAVVLPAGIDAGGARIAVSPYYQRYLLAYHFAGSLSQDIGVMLLDESLAPIGAPLQLGSSVLDDAEPAIAGTMVAWARAESTLGNARRDVVCARIGLQGSQLVVVSPPTVLAGGSGIDEHSPTVAQGRLHHAVAFVRTAAPLDDDVELRLVDDQCAACGTPITLPGVGPGTREGAPSLSMRRWSGAPVGDSTFLLAFTEAQSSPPFHSQVVMQFVNEFADSPAVDLGGACGFGGTATADGPAALGNTTFRFVLSSATPIGVHVLSLGLGTAPIACGPCVLTDPVVLTVAPGAGSANSPFPIPCTPSVAGSQIEAQWLTLFAAVTPCPLVAGLSASNRLHITIAN